MHGIAALPQSGIHVVAVSGGVDSMSLLDMLIKAKSKSEDLRLVVAHFDHGIRADSAADRAFVQEVARQHGLPFVYDQGGLGEDASEATARKARYKFLNQVKKAAKADSIITAHHQDDMLETAIINLLRGTGRRGLTALKSSSAIQRPLLHLTKEQIKQYAAEHKVQWREDITNEETKYLRNYIRHKVLSQFSEHDRKALLSHLDSLTQINDRIDALLVNHLHVQPKFGVLNRHWFIMLPHSVASEVMLSWLKLHEVKDMDKRGVERLLHGSKTLAAGKQMHVNKDWVLHVNKDNLALKAHER